MRERRIVMSGQDVRNAAGRCEQRVAPGVRVTFEADRVLERARVAGQEALVIDNAYFGRMLMIDDAVASSSADEFIYHEMLSHVPVLAHGQVESVLIVGGRDCGLAEEVLKHRGIRTLVQVDADPSIVTLARSYFAGINASVFRDDRFQLRDVDGAGFVASTDERFDLILVDSADPGGTSPSPLTEDFFRGARGCLKPGGLVVARLAIPFLQPLAFSSAMSRLSAVFPVASAYLVPVPSVLGGPVAIGWASNVLDPDQPGSDVLAARFASAGIETFYYTAEIHRASFALPRYIKHAVSAAAKYDQEDGGTAQRLPERGVREDVARAMGRSSAE
jgi:spermidine synthase